MKSQAASTFYCKKNPDLRTFTTDDLAEAFEANDTLLRSIARAGANIPGTRPFWQQHRSHLLALIRNLAFIGAVFCTWSCADHQWDDLHRHFPSYPQWKNGTDQERQRIAAQNVKNYPHIIAAWLDIRFKLYLDIVAKEFFGITDSWYRYEWQARGTGHIHCIIWIESAPKMAPKTVDERDEFAKYWNDRIVAFHPDPMRPQDNRHPCSLPFVDIANSHDQVAALLNRVQRHNTCILGKCLQKKVLPGGGAIERCRYQFPRPLRHEAALSFEVDHKSLRFVPRRNHTRLNDYCPVTLLAWLANTDAQVLISPKAAAEYVAKYASKPEKISQSMQEIQATVMPYISDIKPVVSFVARFLNKLIAERDISAQEVSHFLLRIPFVKSSRRSLTLDCRPVREQDIRIDVNEDGTLKSTLSTLQRYQQRIQKKGEEFHGEDLTRLTLLDFLRNFNVTRWIRHRLTTKPTVVYFFPLYASNPLGVAYEQYCRVKLMLRHPFVEMEDLLNVDGIECESFQEAFAYCEDSHIHDHDDFYDPLPSLDDEELSDGSDDDDWEDPISTPEPEFTLADHEAYAGVRPGRSDGTVHINVDNLGSRPHDLAYDWTPHAGHFVFLDNYWEQVKRENPANYQLPDLSDPSLLNQEQFKLFSAIVGHYECFLDGEDLDPLLFNVDGVAGTGKTYVLLQISAMLEAMALAHGDESPVLRSAPTGIASHNLLGTTLHSLFKIPIRPAAGQLLMKLSTANLRSLQALFKYIKYLIIDEKSMISVMVLALIDQRLREIFPDKQDEYYGGVSVFVCGDFHQLPPIGAPVMYARPPNPKSAEFIAGQQAYRALNTSARLTQLMRQDGEDEESIKFKVALAELRVHDISLESYRLLASRVQADLPQEEIAQFADSLRLYFRREDVKSYNHNRLRDSSQPILLIKSEHTGNNASKATDEEAEGLDTELCLSIGCRVMLTQNLWTENGLVNGSMGTVYDVCWKEGQDTKEMPQVILVKMDAYDGPTFLDTGCIPIFATTRQFRYKRHDCTRKNFPLVLAYAITVHKSQGLTLTKVVISLAYPDHAPGLSYVAISRVKRLSDLMFEQAFDMTRFQMKKSANMEYRRIDWAMRTPQCI